MNEQRSINVWDLMINIMTTCQHRMAAAYLGVKLATLYAYTSRGLVQSVPGPKGRARLYLQS